MSRIAPLVYHLGQRLYHTLIPWRLRRDIWYRRHTGQGYRASLPPSISIPVDAMTAPIHEFFGSPVDTPSDGHRHAMSIEGSQQQLPLVKIIILSYNNPLYTRLTLKSVLEKTDYPRYDVLVVDNASAAATLVMLADVERAHARVTVLRNEHNVGFAGGINVGLRATSDADIVVLLNDDVIVTPGWLTTLVGHLSNPAVGLVGPVTSFTSNAARIPIDYTRIEDIDDFARSYTNRHTQETFAVAMFPMFCVALRRETLDQVGLLDERFAYGMFEDDDYALRLRARGYRIICARDVFVHHFGGTSFAKIEDERFKQIFATNRRAFEEKWQRAWTPPRMRAIRS